MLRYLHSWEELILDQISALEPAEFENLTYDCVRAVGLRNVVWRTPGADGGRDIEGISYVTDLTGHETVSKWYVECKRYSSSIDWPTLWQKVAYADAQSADFLLLVTNSNPSPNCENQIQSWNESKRRPIIRIWRGYDLPAILRANTSIAVLYGLIDDQKATYASALPLSNIVAKLAQSAYVAFELNQNPQLQLEASAALAELVSLRLSDFDNFGKAVPGERSPAIVELDWPRQAGDSSAWESVGLRAVLALAHHSCGGGGGLLTIDARQATLEMVEPRFEMPEQAIMDLVLVGQWAAIEVSYSRAPKGGLVELVRR